MPYKGARPRGGVKLLATNAEAKKIQAHQAEWPMLKLEQHIRRAYTTSTPVLGYAYSQAQPFLNLIQRYRRGRFYRVRNGGVETYYNGLLKGHGGYSHPLLDTLGQPYGPGSPILFSSRARTFI